MEKQSMCPKCGDVENQHKKGFTGGGSQRFFCNFCKYKYTPNPKKWAYTVEERKQALRLIAVGMTGRGVGKVMKMAKSNAYRWSIEIAKKRSSKCG